MKESRGILYNIDWVLVGLFLFLVITGWLNIYSSVYDENHKNIFDFSRQYGKQMIWIGASVFLAIIILFIDSKFFSAFSYVLYVLSLLTLGLVSIAGHEISGSKSWFRIGEFLVQPAEFAKVTTALALSRYLTGLNFTLKNSKNTLIATLIILVPAGLILLQNETGSALVFSSFIFVLLRIGLSPLYLIAAVVIVLIFVFTLLINKFIVIGILVGLGLISFLFVRRKLLPVLGIVGILIVGIGLVFSVDYTFKHILEPHQQRRINVLLQKESDLKGAGYNVNQSLIAIGSGELLGKGYLQGTQTKYNFVPEQSTDFIFCTVGEEWGFAGSLLIIGIFIFLLIRIIRVAERQRSGFSLLYGYAVAGILFFHFMINIGMTLGLVPVIGIPLPFYSYGGSSLWAFTILLFIFIRQDATRFELL